MKKSAFITLLCAGVASCMINPDGSTLRYGDEDSTLEYYNRAMFNFNYRLGKHVFKPVARGYKQVTNQFFRDRVTAVFDNMEEPAYAVNNLLQGEIKDIGISIGRFAVNSTLGLAGMFDVAQGWGMGKKKNSFDGTLAEYCVPDGPFFVLPVVGPATPRYLVGWAADGFASPMYWAVVDIDDRSVDYIVTGSVGLKYLNYYAENMQILDGLEQGSVDFYATIKSAFIQHRQKFASLCKKADESDVTASYDFDFDDDSEDE